MRQGVEKRNHDVNKGDVDGILPATHLTSSLRVSHNKAFSPYIHRDSIQIAKHFFLTKAAEDRFLAILDAPAPTLVPKPHKEPGQSFPGEF